MEDNKYQFKGTQGEWSLMPIQERGETGRYRIIDGLVDVWFNPNAGYSTKEEAEANAHLISAAPDLLEALLAKIEHSNNDAMYDKVIGLNGKELFEGDYDDCSTFLAQLKKKAIHKALNITE